MKQQWLTSCVDNDTSSEYVYSWDHGLIIKLSGENRKEDAKRLAAALNKTDDLPANDYAALVPRIQAIAAELGLCDGKMSLTEPYVSALKNPESPCGYQVCCSIELKAKPDAGEGKQDLTEKRCLELPNEFSVIFVLDDSRVPIVVQATSGWQEVLFQDNFRNFSGHESLPNGLHMAHAVVGIQEDTGELVINLTNTKSIWVSFVDKWYLTKWAKEEFRSFYKGAVGPF